MEKIYCYVDETGQDTRGNLFVVSVVVTDQDRDRAIQLCEEIERETGKGKVKWIKTRYDRRLAYIRRILQEPIFRGRLHFAAYRNTRDYLWLTVVTVAQAIAALGQRMYKATVLIDGLPRSRQRWVGSHLRKMGVRVRKVRGVGKEESDALIRLADALCGFVRAAIEGQEVMRELFERGKREGFLEELEPEEKTPVVRGNSLALRSALGTHQYWQYSAAFEKLYTLVPFLSSERITLGTRIGGKEGCSVRYLAFLDGQA